MAITTQMFEQDRWFHEKAEHEIRERERAAFEAGMAQGGQRALASAAMPVPRFASFERPLVDNAPITTKPTNRKVLLCN